MRPSLLFAALALLPGYALAQAPTLAPRTAGMTAGTVALGNDTRIVGAQTAAQVQAAILAALANLADGQTLTYNSATGQISVVGQAPTAATTVPSLSGLQILLANGQYVTGPQLVALLGTGSTASTPAPTTTVSFAGAAGTQPTGTAALTPVGSNPPTGMALNGSGALLLPSQTYAYALLEGMGTHGDGTLEIDAAGGPQPLDLVVFLNANAGNTVSTGMIFQGEDQHVVVYVPGASSSTTLTTPAMFSKLQMTSANGALTIAVDGATVGSVPQPAASGYIGIGSSSTASPQVAIGQVSFQ